MKTKTKSPVKAITTLLLGCAVAAIAMLSGCATNPNATPIGPALLQLAVTTTAGVEIHNHPETIPALSAAKEIICATANGTNVSVAALVAALDARGNWNTDEWLILNGVIGVLNLAVNSQAPTTNAPNERPYLQATCVGLGDALAFARPPGGVASRSFTASRREAYQRENPTNWPSLRWP